MRSDKEIDLMVGVRLVIILFNLWLITLGIGIGLLALLGFAVVRTGLAQLVFLADLGHFPLDVVRIRGSRRSK